MEKINRRAFLKGVGALFLTAAVADPLDILTPLVDDPIPETTDILTALETKDFEDYLRGTFSEALAKAEDQAFMHGSRSNHVSGIVRPVEEHILSGKDELGGFPVPEEYQERILETINNMRDTKGVNRFVEPNEFDLADNWVIPGDYKRVTLVRSNGEKLYFYELSDALTPAKAGDVINVGQGVFDAPVSINKGISVIGCTHLEMIKVG